MALRLLCLCICSVSLVGAQTVSVTSPTANQQLSGFLGFSFAASVTGVSNASTICYAVDAYPVPGPGPSCSRTPPYAVPWDTYWTLNGSHQVIAKVYGATGTLLASSSPVSFTVANTWPCSWTPGFSPSTGTAVTSNWSGVVSVGGTLSGSRVGSDSMNWFWYVDGIQLFTEANTNASNSSNIDTTRFTDGPHVVAVKTSNNASSCTTYTDGYEGDQTEWTATVNFANGNTASYVSAGVHEIFLSSGGTYNLCPTLYNANQIAAGTQPAFDFISSNTSVATVGTANGSCSLITAVGNGNAQITVGAEAVSGTDLTCATPSVVSSSHPFPWTASLGLVRITGGSGFNTGTFSITGTALWGGSQVAALLSPSPCSTTGSSGAYYTGPGRIVWVYVWPSNTLPHFGIDGSILTSYNPAKSFWLSSGFFSSDAYNYLPGLADAGYNTPNTAATNSLLGFGDDLAHSGFNTIEFQFHCPNCLGGLDLSTSPSQSSFQTAYSNFIGAWSNAFAPWPSIRFFGLGDNLTQGGQLYYATRGSVASQTPPAVQYMFQTMKSAGNFVGINWHDEITSDYGTNPLQGPLVFVSSPTNQSGLTQITSNGSTCTVSMANWLLYGNKFLIHGATTSGFNNSTGTTYTATSVDASHFTFPCSVASGTYNASTDPNLMIEPWAASGWYGSDFLHYDAFADLRTWQTNVSSYTPAAGSPAAGTSNAGAANWSGFGTQSIGSVTQVGDWFDNYWTHTTESYLPSRVSSNAFISDQNGTLEEANYTRSRYGAGFNPSLPMTIITQGTSTMYGWQGYSVPLVGCTNDVCTFSSPHNIPVVIPGATRLWISSSSNSAYNTNFFVNSILSPTKLSVSLASPDFSGSVTGGTLTFQNGDTKSLTSASTPNTITYSGSADNNVPHHRGQTLTMSGTSGTGSATFNSRTFFMRLDNLDLAQDSNGNASANFMYWELPTGTTTGGTATVVADNNFVKGRNGAMSTGEGNNDPGSSFVTTIEAAILRGAGQRFYEFGDTTQGFQPHAVTLSNGVTVKGGWTGLYSGSDVWNFQDNSRDENGPGQLHAHPHWENGFAVPMWHAASLANLLIEGNAKYVLQPSLASPDFGYQLDCAARAGSYGDILMCVNGGEGSQTRTFNLSPYLQPSQQIVRYVADPQWITMTVLAAATASDTVTLGPNDAIFYVFPAAFASELAQPSINVNLSDVPNAASVLVRYHYDLYLLDKPATNVFSCGTGSCILPVNRNIGTVYYRLIYLDANSNVLATSDVQAL